MQGIILAAYFQDMVLCVQIINAASYMIFTDLRTRGKVLMATLTIYNKKLLARRPSEDARQYSYRVIKHHILHLKLLPGQKMSEIDFAHTLNVSRTPIHDTFYKLSRENMVDIFPKQGAFVSRIDPEKVEKAIWLHTQMGLSLLQTIHISDVSASDLDILNYLLNRYQEHLLKDDIEEIPRIINEYYHQIYMLGGNMQYAWEAIQKVDVDLQRLLSLALFVPAVSKGIFHELSSLADALLVRQNDKACTIFEEHLEHVLLFLEPLKKHYPDYFTSDKS